uniref:Uncharacterized protein n=1 Tax=viral metagenome TaxID=1070528 RepID=A0A6M3IKK8_9ZZZZ
MKFISLRIPKRSKAEAETVVNEHDDQYPWGLILRFETEEIKKILYLQRIDGGEDCEFIIKGYASRISINEDSQKAGQKKVRKQVEIQVTDIAFPEERDRPEDMSQAEYEKWRKGK